MRRPPLILVVDDNPTNIDILQMRLMANNYEVITATDGAMGLDMAIEKVPDLILLDIMMPKMDGLEVCRKLKKNSDLPFIPIILVTAKTDSKDVVAGLEAGGDEYLTKPVDHAALVARVKSMLRIKSLHDTVLEQSTQLKKQLKTASNIQTLFWPKIPQLASGSHIWAVSIPAYYVGGDLYDIITLSDGSLLAYVADVSDKGVPAALIMAALSSKIRSEAKNNSDIGQLLYSINNNIYKLLSDEGYFATIVLVRFWPNTGKMELSLGGHLEPLWISNNKILKLPQLNGISLGIMANASYDKAEITLSPGESMLLYSDGLIEAVNEKQEFFGRDRLIRHVKRKDKKTVGEGLLDEIRKWQGNTIMNDDLTILEIWRDCN